MRRVILAVVGTIAGLVGLLSFKTHPSAVAGSAAVSTVVPGSSTATATSAGAKAEASTSAAAKASTGAAAKTSPSATKTAGTAKAATTKTVTGDSIDTRWGPVQVRIVVTNGKLSSVTAVDYPQNTGRDQEINASAIPALNAEAIAAGNAKIDMISGATYTSTGYIDSLQSALDKAGL